MNQVKQLYQDRNAALLKVKSKLKRSGRVIKKVDFTSMRNLSADFYMDEDLCKFKMTNNKQVNLIFEAMNNGRPGWFETTKAKYFVYFIKPDNAIYIVDVQRVKDYIKNPLLATPEKTSKGAIGDKNSWSWMIPIDICKHYNLIKEIIYIGGARG